MIYVVSGSREIFDDKAVESILGQYFGVKDEVHVGDARGVDAIVRNFAQRRFCKLVVHPADWSAHDRAAGPIRNREMVEVADVLIAIWDGQSRGTKSTIDLALAAKLETHVYFL